MPGKPGDLGAALERSLRERVSKAVERSFLLCRSDPPDGSGGHRRVELASGVLRLGARRPEVAVALPPKSDARRQIAAFPQGEAAGERWRQGRGRGPGRARASSRSSRRDPLV